MTEREKALLMVGIRLYILSYVRRLGKSDEAGEVLIAAILDGQEIDEELFARVSLEAAEFIGIATRQLTDDLAR